MHAFTSCRVLCVLGLAVTSFCMNGLEYEVGYDDYYENGITAFQEKEEDPQNPPCQKTEFTRWDKLFIALEDSHMRQNMLQDSLETCTGGMGSFRNQVEKLSKGTSCKQCLPGLESACKAKAEQVIAALRQGMAELREQGAERERRLNSTLHKLLHGSREENARLRGLLEVDRSQASAATSTPTPTPTPTPGRPGRPSPSGLGGQEAMSAPDLEKALVTIATELQRVQVQLSRAIEQAETLRKSGPGGT